MDKLKLTPSKIADVMMQGGALSYKSEHYPNRFEGKVPALVLMKKTAESDLPAFLSKDLPKAIEGQEYWVNVNSHGAVSVIFPDGQQLGVKPDEFDVILYHPKP